jgi:hypothetical protein
VEPSCSHVLQPCARSRLQSAESERRGHAAGHPQPARPRQRRRADAEAAARALDQRLQRQHRGHDRRRLSDESIRDLSTDPIIRLNVFKKERVPVGSAKLSLNDVENDKIREGFKDPRIHFAINCAAKSCPPIRTEAFTGEKLDAQLDAQARAFLNGPHGARFKRDGDTLTITVTKIMDWFSDDFDKWSGGKAAFIRKYVSPDKQQLIDQAKDIDFEFDDYDWALNDWRR